MAAGDPDTPYVQAANDGTEGDNGAFLKQLASALVALSAGVGGHALANANSQSSVPPQLLQLLDNSVARQGYQNPLFQATTKGTYDMLPTFAKEGSALSGSLPSTLPPAQPWTGGSGGPGLKTAATLGGAGTLASLLGNNSKNSMDLGKIFAAIKKLFSRNQFGSIDNSGALPNYNPFDNGNWDGIPPNNGGQPGLSDPGPNVTTDYNVNGWGNDPENPASAVSNWWDDIGNAGSQGAEWNP